MQLSLRVSPSPFLPCRNGAAIFPIDSKDLQPHKYGCLMAILPEKLRKEITDWCLEIIPDCHLGVGGRELTPHLTIKYGFEDSGEATVTALKAMLLRCGPIPIELKGMTLFTGVDEGDVLKIDVEGKELRRLNSEISDSFPCHDSRPEYLPHVTVAYLDPKISASYDGSVTSFTNQRILLDEVEWSGSDGERERFSLFHRPMFETKVAEEKTLSYLNTSTGGALVPPAKQGKPVRVFRNKKKVKAGFTGKRPDKS